MRTQEENEDFDKKFEEMRQRIKRVLSIFVDIGSEWIELSTAHSEHEINGTCDGVDYKATFAFGDNKIYYKCSEDECWDTESKGDEYTIEDFETVFHTP